MTSSRFRRDEYLVQLERSWELNSLSASFKMLSTKEMFYGPNEPTYIVKKKIQGTNPRPELVLSSMPFYPDVGKGGSSEEVTKKDPDVVLWVPMCCGQCEERIIVPVSQMEGVKSVQCNWYKKKVVVSGKGLSALSILLKCQSIFCKAAYWKDD